MEVETSELVADRIWRAVKHLDDPPRIWVNSYSGLRSCPLDIAAKKLDAIVAGAAIARLDFASSTP